MELSLQKSTARIFLTRINILIFVYLTQRSRAGHVTEMYFNPWHSIVRNPQIIRFDSSGKIEKEYISQSSIVEEGDMNDIFNSTLENTTEIVNTTTQEPTTTTTLSNGEKQLKSLIENARRGLKPGRKAKILTNCRKNMRRCRLLSCPKIQQYCTLCEVNLKQKNETKCENYSTSFLFGIN